MLFKTVLSAFFIILLAAFENGYASADSSKKLLIAIIDTGTNTGPEPIQKKLWINKREIPGNHIDDDKNGFVDDIYGWNFVNNSPNIEDVDGHGTHITSIISEKSADQSLMILKYYQHNMDPQKNLQNCLKAFSYAIDMGANVINFSGGGYGPSTEEKLILQRAADLGILVIAAAGNDHGDNDHTPYFPASYSLPNILAIGSLNKNGAPSDFSNFGSTSVPIFAPGEDIIGYGIWGEKTKMSGTSQATAIVSREIADYVNSHPKSDVPNAEFLQKIIISRSSSKEMNLSKIASYKSQKESALGVKLSSEESEQWVFHTQ